MCVYYRECITYHMAPFLVQVYIETVNRLQTTGIHTHTLPQNLCNFVFQKHCNSIIVAFHHTKNDSTYHKSSIRKFSILYK